MEKYGNKFLLSKKILGLLGFLFVVWSISLGLVVYYAGVANLDDQGSGIAEPKAEPEPAPKSDKVTDATLFLPTHLVPLVYRLRLIPFIMPDNFTVKGDVEIEMDCESAGRNITVHSADMDIQNSSVTVQDMQGNSVGINRFEYDSAREFYIVHLDSDLAPANKYKIKIPFTFDLKPNLKGFYRSTYKNRETNEDEYLASTQFQPADARRAFPCFDEPAIKAKFEVSLGRTREFSSISNMPIRSEGEDMSEDPDYVWDHYQQSVKMSTYLVAFVVSKFEHRDVKRSNDVLFRIWSRKDAIDQTEYARDIGPKILEFFETYFGVKFPLPKQDMIALPDFAAGAMENWGLITYREVALLFKEGVSAAKNKQRVALVVSHELAHQWFGNLVTPRWWNDLWLNEGFATYVEYLGVDAVQPEIKLMAQFIKEQQYVMGIDALQSSHPVKFEVRHPDEVLELFDAISYKKGASVIRMMDNFLTSSTFTKGLSKYLTEYSFKAAEQDDLWRHLTQQGHSENTLPASMSVKEVMDTWTLQTGFPVITVTRQYGAKTATIQQSRFLLDGGASTERWWVPITFTTPGQGNFNNTYNNVWMSPQEGSKRITGMPAADKPVIFNVQATAFYRTNYDKKNWEKIAASLKTDHTSIHVINRAQILDDAFNLAKAGYLDYATALSLTNYLENETEFIPWYSALRGLSYINRMLVRSSAYGDFKRYMLKLLTPIYRRVGYRPKADDEHLDILLRTKVVEWACSMGHEECLMQVRENFDEWMGDINPDLTNPIDVNMKGVAYCSAISQGGEKEWDFAWERYENANVASEKADILNNLGCTKEVWLLNRYLDKSLNESLGVRKQDGYKAIGGVAGNRIGRYLAFNFLRENWSFIKDYFTGFSAVKRVVQSLSSTFNTEFDTKELMAFEKAHQGELGSSTRAVKQAIEASQANVEWMTNNFQVVWDWLKTNTK